MSSSSIILPADKKKQYLLCYMKYYLEHTSCAYFTSNEIAETLSGLIKGSDITRLLTRWEFKSLPSSKRIGGGSPKSIKKYDTKKVLDVLQINALHSFDYEQLRKAWHSKSSIKTIMTATFSRDFNRGVNSNIPEFTSYKAVDIPVINVPYFITYWNDVFNNRYSYSDSYSFVSKLPLLTHNTFKADKSYCYDGISPCIELPKEHVDTKGYSFVNQSLLNKLGLPDLDINTLASKYNHRLIAQVNDPTRQWHLPRGHKDYLSVHHLCFNRSCINKDHLMVMLESLHTALHNSLPEEKHPYYSQHLYFDKVETNIITKPKKPASNVIPFYKVNRHNGIDFNPNLLIDLGDGVPIKITTLPSNMLHNFEEGLNYKGK